MKSIRTKFCIYLHPKLKLNGVGFMRTFQGSKTFYKCLQMLLLMQFYADKYICTYPRLSIRVPNEKEMHPDFFNGFHHQWVCND